ncbi:MAG: hypothetical protein WBZ54_02560 [Methylocella sp.]
MPKVSKSPVLFAAIVALLPGNVKAYVEDMALCEKCRLSPDVSSGRDEAAYRAFGGEVEWRRQHAVINFARFSTRLIGSPLITFRVSELNMLLTPPSEPLCGNPSSISATPTRAAKPQPRPAAAEVPQGLTASRLKPVECVSRFKRDNWLSNQVFISYHRRPPLRGWNKLVNQP